MEKKWVTITTAAELAHCSRPRIYAALRRGELIRMDAEVALLDRKAVLEWAKREKSKGGKPTHKTPQAQGGRT